MLYNTLYHVFWYHASARSFTHLRGEIPPFCWSLVMHSDTPNSSQDDILGNLHSQTSHTRDEDIGVLHALHSVMAQHVTAEREYNQHNNADNPKIHFEGWQFPKALVMLCSQLSGVQAFIDLSIISILSHALGRVRSGNWMSYYIICIIIFLNSEWVTHPSTVVDIMDQSYKHKSNHTML